MRVVSGPWTVDRVEEYFRAAVIPVRLACPRADGWPLVISLWYLYRDGMIWCATQATAKVAWCVEQDGRCGFEIGPNSPPYCGVRGRGRAVVDRQHGREILGSLIDRYLGSKESSLSRWLLGRADQEVAIRIADLRVSSWDYTERMEGSAGQSVAP
jgi:hypothetical protein